jgi:hypothetical protein
MAAAAPARHPARRTRPLAPRNPRRVSGPVARPRPRPVPAPATRPGAAERLRALPDHRFLDRLLHGRAWIWLIGLALGGIVAMQVSLLKLNSGISRAVQASSTLERQNSDLEASIAKLSSGERIRLAAQARGMVTPPAGDLRYLRVRPGQDAYRAASRITPPSDAARLLMANGGREPGALALAPAAGAVAPVVSDQTQAQVPTGAPVVADPAAATTAPEAPAAAPAAEPEGGAPAPVVTPAPGTTDTAAAPAPTGPQG